MQKFEIQTKNSTYVYKEIVNHFSQKNIFPYIVCFFNIKHM